MSHDFEPSWKLIFYYYLYYKGNLIFSIFRSFNCDLPWKLLTQTSNNSFLPILNWKILRKSKFFSITSNTRLHHIPWSRFVCVFYLVEKNSVTIPKNTFIAFGRTTFSKTSKTLIPISVGDFGVSVRWGEQNLLHFLKIIIEYKIFTM